MARRWLAYPPLRRLLVIWLIAATVIGLAAYGIFAFARGAVVRHQWGLLEAIADDREAAIAAWIGDRRDEARRFLDNPAYLAAMTRLLAHRAPGDAGVFLRRDLEVLLRRPHYEAAALMAPDGRVRYALGTAQALTDLPAAATTPRSEIAFHEMIVGVAPHREVRIVMSAPLWRAGRFIGTLAFVIHPYREITPVLTTWPWPDSSVEALLLHRRGDEIVYLTGARDVGEAVLIVRADPALLAAQAIGGSGRLRGRDYHGEQSVGIARSIAGTPWHLLVKIDSAELHGLIRDLGLFAAGLSLLLIALAGVLAYSRVDRLQARHREALLQAEVDKQALARRFDYLAKYANDIIVLADEDGRILEVNDRALETYGYTRDEMLRLTLFDLVPAEDAPAASTKWEHFKQQGDAIFEVANRKKNGERFYVECSFRLIDIGGKIYVQDIMRDISERKKAEARIRRLNRLYLTLSRTNEAILNGHSEKELLENACGIAVAEGGFLAAWVARTSRDGRHLDVLTFCGPGEREFRRIMSPPMNEIARGANASTLAVRERRTTRINDYQRDPRVAAMHDWARRNGAHAVAAFPIVVDERPYGVFGVQANTIDAFDDEIASLLERTALNLGYAVRNLRQAQALAESEERLSLVFRATRDCYWDLRIDRGIGYFSPPFRRRFGLPSESMRLDDAAALLARRIHPHDLPAVRDEAQAFLHGVRHRTASAFRITIADGRERWVKVKGQVVEPGDGAPRRIVGAITDITDERRAQQDLQYWEKVFRDSRESIVILDRERRILAANQAFTDMTGYEAHEVVGRDAMAIGGKPAQHAVLEQAWQVLLAAGQWQGELHGRRKNGEALAYWVTASRIAPGPNGEETFVTLSTDLTESKTASERIRFLSNYDSLTGLPNRALFGQLLDQAVSHAQRKGGQLAVLFLDIDRFKNVNDSLGHAVGDLLLQELAERMTNSVGAEDTISRQSGDDFLVLLAAPADANHVTQTALTLLDAAAQPFSIAGHEISLTASIGIAVFPLDGTDAETLIKNADTAMYYSKERGPNNFQFFFHDLNVRARRRLSLATELRRTLERGDFALHYQPQVDAVTGTLVGLEALIRWPHEGRLVAPAEFIPMAEDLGLIVPIGDWVMQAACRQRNAWSGALGRTLLAVNLSALQFHEKSAIERLSLFVADTCAPRSIEFELTESAVMREAEESVKIFHALKERGVRLALDDFGTGYSSLNYLRRFPMDRIKVDQSFIHDLASEASNRTITDAIIGLSKGLGMTVLAEGVETREELALLQLSGCDEVQGFYIAPPLPPAELVAWWLDRCNSEASKPS